MERIARMWRGKADGMSSNIPWSLGPGPWSLGPGPWSFLPHSVIFLDGSVKGILLELMDVMLGLFHALARKDALAGVMDLEHVVFGFGFGPAENNLEDVCHVLHQVHRIIPANDEVTRLEGFLGFGPLAPMRSDVRNDL